MVALGLDRGYIEIMEEKMETSINNRAYSGI